MIRALAPLVGCGLMMAVCMAMMAAAGRRQKPSDGASHDEVRELRDEVARLRVLAERGEPARDPGT